MRLSYKIETNQEKIVDEYDRFCKMGKIDSQQLDDNYKNMRNAFVEKYWELKNQGYLDYKLDLYFGLFIYDYLNNQNDFTNIYESNYNFWRYIAVFVIPDIISDRFGIGTEEKYRTHFYKKTVRIYPYTLYWYIHLSWQGDYTSTLELLKDNTTDEILQFVERPSKVGINLELYRTIIKKYSLLRRDDKFININGKKITKFRLVLTKNTCKMLVIRPELYPGGIFEYVNMLFCDL